MIANHPKLAHTPKKHGSLNSLLTLISVAIFAILCLATALVSKEIFENDIETRAQERISELAETINFAFETMIDRNDVAGLQRVVENVGANPEVRRLTIVNRDLAILADKTNTSDRIHEQERLRNQETDMLTRALRGERQIIAEQDSDGAKLLTVALPLRGGQFFPEFHSDIVGVIRLSYDLRSFHAAARQQAALAALAQCVAFLVVIVMLNLLTRRFILKPVRELALASHRLAEGDLTASVIIQGHTEIAELGGAFNNMASNLSELMRLRELSVGAEARVTALQGANTDLQVEIAERKLTERRLMDTQASLEEQRRAALSLAANAEEGRQRSEQAEARFKTLLEAVPDAMVIIDESSRMVLVNAQAERLFGYTRAELLGQPVEMLIPEPYRASHPEQRMQYLKAPMLRPMGAGRNLAALHKSGREVPVEISLSPLKVRGQVFVLSILRDISERRRSEGRLAARREVTEILTTAVTAQEIASLVLPVIGKTTGWEFGAVWMPDPGTHVLRCVESRQMGTAKLDSFETLTRSSTFACGTGLPGRIWASARPIWIPNVTKDDDFLRAPVAVEVGLRGAFGFPLRLGEEVLGVIEFFSADIREPDADLLEMFDIIGSQIGQFMERKRAEESELHANQKYRSIFDNAVEGIFQTTVNGKFLTVNPAMAQMLGYKSPKELMAAVQDVARQLYVNPSRRQEYAALLAEHGVVSGFECEFLRKDGTPIWVSLTARVIRNSKGEITNYEGTIENISPRKLVEEQLRQAQKMEAVGRLAGGVAHDFNNLLTVINGFSEIVIAQMATDNPQRGLLEEVLKAGDRAADLTRQLLAFSRKQVLEPKVLILTQLVTDSEKILRRLIGEDVELSVKAAPDLWPVMADPGQMQQVIMNLVVNARDAMPSGGQLLLETANVDIDPEHADKHADVAPGPFVRFAVTDTGDGMDPATRARIFEPFFTTKGPDKGTGLGLAVVYGIIKQSGGFISVYTEPGHGTTFKIYLPRYLGIQVMAEKPTEPLAIPRGTETILLVEDDDAVRQMASQSLKQCGYTVILAGNGVEGLHVAAEQTSPFHLVITDVIMPNLNGKEMVDQLVVKHPGLKVLYTSGYTSDVITHHGVLDQVTAFLQKPYSPGVLARKVRAVLDA